MENQVLGIDIGGSGIKGAIIDINTGELLTDRIKIKTPKPATPEAVADTVLELVQRLNYKGLIGCGFPAIIKNGVAKSASNIDKSWIDVAVDEVLSSKTGMKVFVANDADVAGMAEQAFGLVSGEPGTVIVLTLGTGIGSALFYHGILVPNTELGHLKFKGGVLESYASNKTREELGLDWKTYGTRLNKALQHIEFLFSPNLMIIGGGLAKKFDEFKPYLQLQTKVVPAKYGNNAGLIGAALYAYRH
ncbi:MAG TPA: ROK family protein [Saprospiraceae bacterium]|nr:ROK family protein [Saprospiraceae bacterium]HQW56840.1 ROK family protein [Saprospiraceae bacterium]